LKISLQEHEVVRKDKKNAPSTLQLQQKTLEMRNAILGTKSAHKPPALKLFSGNAVGEGYYDVLVNSDKPFHLRRNFDSSVADYHKKMR
jgi:hypothetical protein